MPIQWPGNPRFRAVRTKATKWAGLPSCWKMRPSTSAAIPDHFHRQRMQESKKNYRRVVFYARRDASKENRRIVQLELPVIQMFSLSASVIHRKWRLKGDSEGQQGSHISLQGCHSRSGFVRKIYRRVLVYTYVIHEGRVSVNFHGIELNCSSFLAHRQRVLNY
jgi:hypothetical protein